MTDITGISKVLPMDKLVDVLSSAFGRITKSYYDRKDADSKAYEIRKIAEAKAFEFKVLENAKKEISEGNFDFEQGLIDRSESRVLYKELKKQNNIENIAHVAAEQLKEEEEVSQEPVDEDWTNRFFNYAEDVSNEEMQKLWGRILAGEIKRPNSFSLRTLEFIRNLTKEEANVFTKIGSCAIFAAGKYFVDEETLKSRFDVKLDEILILKELGLLNSNELQLEFKNEKGFDLLLKSGGKGLLVKRNELGSKKQLQGTVFTKLGTELLSLISISYRSETFSEIKKKLIDNETVDFKIGDYVEINNMIYLRNLKDFV